MAEIYDDIQYNPTVDAVGLKYAEMLYDRIVPQIAEEALAVVMDSWDSEQGYDFSGSPFQWARSPKSTRTNSILFDTGTLKSSISIVYTQDSTPFYFQASGKQYDDGQSVESVSEHNSNNPHDNVPAEYRAGGKEFKRIIAKGRSSIVDDLIDDGSIVIL